MIKVALFNVIRYAFLMSAMLMTLGSVISIPKMNYSSAGQQIKYAVGR